MANNFFIKIKLETETVKQATELHQELQAAFEEADREMAGAFFGSSRYLFEGHTEQTGTEVVIGGWVKWGYRDYEFADMFGWLRTKVTVKRFNMRYEEWGCLLYGEFDFNGETMKNHFLEEKDFPKPTSSDFDNFKKYREKVEAVYQKKHSTRIISID